MLLKHVIGLLMPILIASNVAIPAYATSVHAAHASVLGVGDMLQKLNVTKSFYANDPKDAAVWKNVFTVLDRLKYAPTCGINAASRLFTACADLGDNADRTVPQVDSVKALYAVRMAICETAEGGAKVPNTCHDAMPATNPATSKKKVVDVDLGIMRSGSMTACIQSLQKEHFYWTSYSNHRQEASSVCDSMQSGVELQKIIMFYREVVDSMAEIVQTLEKHRSTSDQWFHTTEDHLQVLYMRYFDMVEMMEQSLKEHDQKTTEAMANFQEVTMATNATVVGVNLTMSSVYSSLLHLQSMLPTVNSNLGRIVADASQGIVEVANTGRNELIKATSPVIDMLSTTMPEAIEELIAQLRTADNVSASILHSQKQQILLADYLTAAVQNSLVQQNKTQDLIAHTLGTMETISSDIEIIAGPIRLVAAVLRSYQESKWAIGMIDLAIFGAVSSASTFLILMPGHRILGVYLFLAYCFLLSIKGCIYYADPLSKIMNLVSALNDITNMHNMSTIIAAMAFGLVAAYTTIHLMRQVAMKKAIRELHEFPFSRPEASSCTEYHIHRETRASTAPPDL